MYACKQCKLTKCSCSLNIKWTLYGRHFAIFEKYLTEENPFDQTREHLMKIRNGKYTFEMFDFEFCGIVPSKR